jgi:hypothetical protein
VMSESVLGHRLTSSPVAILCCVGMGSVGSFEVYEYVCSDSVQVGFLRSSAVLAGCLTGRTLACAHGRGSTAREPPCLPTYPTSAIQEDAVCLSIRLYPNASFLFYSCYYLHEAETFHS